MALSVKLSLFLAIVGRAISIWEAIQKRSHEPIYKTHTKIEAKRLRAITNWGAIEKSNIAIAILKKLKNFKGNKNCFSHFDGRNNIFADCILIKQ